MLCCRLLSACSVQASRYGIGQEVDRSHILHVTHPGLEAFAIDGLARMPGHATAARSIPFQVQRAR